MIDRIGHIGIGIRPSERAKGYGKELIMMALDECRKINLEKVLLTCNKLNVASSNTIKRCGGILENEITIINEEGNIEDVLRYWINL
jgi:predicted acetyltransferase